MAKEETRRGDSRVVVHALNVLALALIPFALVFRPWDTEGLALLLAAWAIGSFLTYTTAPLHQPTNALFLLLASVAGVMVVPPLGVPFLLVMVLVKLISRKKAAKSAVATAPSADTNEAKPQVAKEGTDPTELTEEQLAAIRRIRTLLAGPRNTLDPEQLFPYLNRPGFSEEATTASKRLIETWGESPLVTLGHDAGLSIVFAGRAELTEQNQRLALTNLRARKGRAPWERDGLPTGEMEFFWRSGDELTASDLLDSEFLEEARERCGSNTVFFAVPMRQSMLMASEPDTIAIMAKVRFERTDTGEHPLSPALFVFDGEGPLVGFVPKLPQVPQISQGAQFPQLPQHRSERTTLSGKLRKEPDSQRPVHVCQGIALALLVYKRLLSPEENFAGLIDTRPFVTWMLFITWGIAYYLAYTTPPVRRTSNAVTALSITALGVFTQSVLGFPFLAVLWWRRRTARILTRIVQDDAEASAQAERPKRKRKNKKNKRSKRAAKEPEYSEAQLASIGRLTALAMQHGSALAPESLFPFMNRPGFSEEATTASERLIETWNESPLVTLGHDADLSIILAARSELTEEHKRIALANLRSRKERADWERECLPTPDGEVELFARIGDELTASDLLDPEFLKDALELCGSDKIFLAIPTRAAMVMASEPDIVALAAKQRFEDDEHDERLLTPAIFLFDGEGPLVPLIPQIPESNLH